MNQNSSDNNLPLRPNVCLLLTNKDRRLFLGERNNNPGIWQFPQGGVEPGLSLEENVIKELFEETGADEKFFRIIKKLSATHEYDFIKTPEYAKDKWRGQAQTFWLVEFLGTDSDFKLDRFQPEFMNFQWVTADDVRRLAEPRRLEGYKAPLMEYEKWLMR